MCQVCVGHGRWRPCVCGAGLLQQVLRGTCLQHTYHTSVQQPLRSTTNLGKAACVSFHMCHAVSKPDWRLVPCLSSVAGGSREVVIHASV